MEGGKHLQEKTANALPCMHCKAPPPHMCFLLLAQANRAIYMNVSRLRVTVTLHPAILTTGTLFKPTTGEWQQTMTECLFSIVRRRKMKRHSAPRRLANKLLCGVLSWSNCSVGPLRECTVCVCGERVCMPVCVCLCEWTYRSSAIYFPELGQGS